MTEEYKIEAKSFVIPVSEERIMLKSLKYTLYASGLAKETDTKILNKGSDIDNVSGGGWASLVIDNKEKRIILCGCQEETKNSRMELMAIIQGLKWILSEYDEKVRRHVQITLITDSVYAINCIREWIPAWKSSNFEMRPNADLLIILNDLLEQTNIDTKSNIIWNPKNANECMRLVSKLALEQKSEIGNNKNSSCDEVKVN